MRIAIVHSSRSDWHSSAHALARGIERTGDEAPLVPFGTPIPEGCDAVCTWGWKRGKRIVTRGSLPVLVMERGFIGDRFKWTSLGWNGLNGRAAFGTAPTWRPDYAARFWKHHDMHGWRDRPNGYALLMGQVAGDAACDGVNLPHFYATTLDTLRRAGYEVRFRAHPLGGAAPVGVRRWLIGGTLAEALAGAQFAVTWNSNAAVDAVLAGVPAVALDQGSMAWQVASHSLDNPVTMPVREGWAYNLAWKQWLPEELADGTAWRTIREGRSA